MEKKNAARAGSPASTAEAMFNSGKNPTVSNTTTGMRRRSKRPVASATAMIHREQCVRRRGLELQHRYQHEAKGNRHVVAGEGDRRRQTDTAGQKQGHRREIAGEGGGDPCSQHNARANREGELSVRPLSSRPVGWKGVAVVFMRR
jgi:hypothetical protein